jgi:hypothetical protein
VALAAVVRIASHVQVRDGSIPWLHRWAQSDMAFNDAWARDIAGGNVFGVPAPRPYHRWHGEVAAEAHRLLGVREPFDESWARALWNRWLGDRSFYQDPLFPYALALVYAAGGGPGTAWVLQAALGVAVVGLVAFIAGELWGARIGLLAGMMAALYAPLIFYEGMLVRSILQAVALAGSEAAAVQAPRAARPAFWWSVCGACTGLGVVAHATSGLYAAALGVWLAATRTPDRRFRDVLAYGGGVLLALLPLAARNAAVGRPLHETSSARAVNVVTALAADAQPRAGFHISAHTARILAETDGRFLPTVRATLATHPGVTSVLAQTGRKFLAFWESREATDNASFDYFLVHASLVSAIGLRFAAVAPVAVFGMLLCGRRPGRAAPLMIAAASVLAVALLFFPSSRVRFPVAVALIPFAAYGIAGAVSLARQRRYARFGALAAGGMAAAVLVAAPWQPAEGDLRETDYAVGNEIALLRLRAAADDPDAQVRIVAAQLRTEPEALRALEPAPGTRAVIPSLAARLAGSFAGLHAAGARAYAARGDRERAAFHARRAEVLAVVARQAAGERPY